MTVSMISHWCNRNVYVQCKLDDSFLLICKSPNDGINDTPKSLLVQSNLMHNVYVSLTTLSFSFQIHDVTLTVSSVRVSLMTLSKRQWLSPGHALLDVSRGEGVGWAGFHGDHIHSMVWFCRSGGTCRILLTTVAISYTC